MRHTFATNTARTLLVISALLGSFPAIAEEANGAGHSRLHASQEPVVCDWLVTNKVLTHQTHWGCWEPATGYVRTAISSTSVENYEGNELQSASRTRRKSEINGSQLPSMQ